jgi:hypothetical protein
MEVNISVAVFWDTTPYGLEKSCRPHFGGNFRNIRQQVNRKHGTCLPIHTISDIKKPKHLLTPSFKVQSGPICTFRTLIRTLSQLGKYNFSGEMKKHWPGGCSRIKRTTTFLPSRGHFRK